MCVRSLLSMPGSLQQAAGVCASQISVRKSSVCSKVSPPFMARVELPQWSKKRTKKFAFLFIFYYWYRYGCIAVLVPLHLFRLLLLKLGSQSTVLPGKKEVAEISLLLPLRREMGTVLLFFAVLL